MHEEDSAHSTMEHPHSTHTFHAHSTIFLPQQHFISFDLSIRSVFFFMKFSSTRIESPLVICFLNKKVRFISYTFYTLAADNVNTLDEHGALWKHEVNNRKIHSSPRPDTSTGLCSCFLVVASTAHQQGTSPKMLAPKTHLKTMSPKLDTKSHAKYSKGHLAEGNSMQAQVRSSPRDSAMQNMSKNTVSFQTGDSSILGKGKHAWWEDPVPIHFKELNRVGRPTQKLAHTSKIWTTELKQLSTDEGRSFPDRKEALMKFASHGYRQILLELVDDTGALEAPPLVKRSMRT